MRTGLLKNRIMLLKQVKTETEYSINEPEYASFAEVWAYIQHKGGSIDLSAEMVSNTPRVIFTIRDHLKVEYGMKIEFQGIKYLIVDIDDTTIRGYIRITVEAEYAR